MQQRKKVVFIADSLDNAHKFQAVLSGLDVEVIAVLHFNSKDNERQSCIRSHYLRIARNGFSGFTRDRKSTWWMMAIFRSLLLLRSI